MNMKITIAALTLATSALCHTSMADETGITFPAGAGLHCFKITVQESGNKYAVDYDNTNTLATFGFVGLLVDAFQFFPLTIASDGSKCSDNISNRITGITPVPSSPIPPPFQPQPPQPPFQDVGTAVVLQASLTCFEAVMLQTGFRYAVEYSTAGVEPAIGWISLFTDYGGQNMTLSTDGTVTDCGEAGGVFYRLHAVKVHL